MDIIALFASGMVVRLEELILGKPYLILYIEKFRTFDGQQTLIKLCFDSRRDAFVILPEDCSLPFTSSQMARINNKTLYNKLILLGFTHLGKPILQFQYAGGTIWSNCNSNNNNWNNRTAMS